MRPVGRPGIDLLQVRKGKTVLEQLGKSDLPPSLLGGTERHDTSIGNTSISRNIRQILLRVTRVNFDEGKWGFSDGNAKFNATIEDVGFKTKLDSGQEGFYKGDVLRVELTTVQTVDSTGNFKSEYRIERVMEHIHALK